MNSQATNQPWPVGWHCTLAATNRDGVKATDIDLRQRCSLLSCPACSSFDVRKRVQGMIRAANEWRLCRLAPTIPLGPIDVALFGPGDVEPVFQLADDLAARLNASGEVVGFLLKVEFAPGRKGTSNAAQVVLPHIHAELLSRSPLTRADVERIVGRQLPGLHLQPCDSGWTRYLGKPVISDGDNWNPVARRSVVDALDKWQRTKQRYSRSKRKRGKRCHAYRFGGLAHGNGFRWARNAMERCAEIEKLTGHEKQAALKAAQRSVSFKKWSGLWSLWRGPEKYSGRFTQLDLSKLCVPALPAVVVIGKIGGAKRAKRADARSPCLPAPFANCLRGALKSVGRAMSLLVALAQTADCLLKGGQAGAARTHTQKSTGNDTGRRCQSLRIRDPPRGIAAGACKRLHIQLSRRRMLWASGLI